MSFIDWSLYKKILEAMPIVCVDVAIVSNSGVLLVRRRDAPARDQFWLPGGRVNKGEMLREAAARKARDETGIVCRVGPLIYTDETIFEDGPGGIAVHSVNTCFKLFTRRTSVPIVLDEHHQEWIWATEIDKNLHPYVQACLGAAGLR